MKSLVIAATTCLLSLGCEAQPRPAQAQPSNSEEKVLIVQGTGFNWPAHDHFRLVFLPNVDDLREAVGRIDRFLAGYRRRHSA